MRAAIAVGVLGMAFCAALAPHQARAAGGAFAVDDAAIGEVKDCKVESWVSFASNDNFNAVTSPACVVDFGFRPIEIGGQFQHSRTTDTSGDFPADAWSRSGALKAKTYIIPLAETAPSFGLAVSGAVGFDLITREATSYSANVPLTYEFADKTFRLNANVGWLYDRVADLHYYTWGGGFEWVLAKKDKDALLTLIAEVYGQGGQHPDPIYVVEPRAQVGFRVTPQSNVDIDLIYGRNIAGENANWFTIGFNYRFSAK